MMEAKKRTRNQLLYWEKSQSLCITHVESFGYLGIRIVCGAVFVEFFTVCSCFFCYCFFFDKDKVRSEELKNVIEDDNQ